MNVYWKISLNHYFKNFLAVKVRIQHKSKLVYCIKKYIREINNKYDKTY